MDGAVNEQDRKALKSHSAGDVLVATTTPKTTHTCEYLAVTSASKKRRKQRKHDANSMLHHSLKLDPQLFGEKDIR